MPQVIVSYPTSKNAAARPSFPLSPQGLPLWKQNEMLTTKGGVFSLSA